MLPLLGVGFSSRSVMGSVFSCGECTVSELAWKKLVTKLVKILKCRRLFNNLGFYLRQFSALQLPGKLPETRAR